MSRRQNSLMRFSRTERLAQLSEQEIVIERKKKEILAKLEAQKKKVSEEALRKPEPAEELYNKSKFSENLPQNRDECQREENKETLFDKSRSERLTNAFSNDGSFLDQFKKLTNTSAAQNISDVQNLKLKEKNLRSGGNAEAVKNAFKSLGVNSQSPFLRKSLESSIQLQLPPPGVVQLMAPHQASELLPLSQNSASVPLSVPILMPHLQNSTNPVKFNSSSQQVPPVEVFESGFGLDEKNISGGLSAFSNSVSAFSQPSKASLKSSLSIPSVPKKSELPKVRSESISMTLKSNLVKKLEAIPNPLDIDDEALSPPSAKKSHFVFSDRKENWREGGGNFSKTPDSLALMRSAPTYEDSLNVSSALTEGKKNEKEDGDYSEDTLHKWAKLVAQCGDDFEEMLKKQNDNDLRFMKEKESNEYQRYRELVSNYRSNFSPLSPEIPEKQIDKSLVSTSTELEEKNFDDKIKFSKQRPSNLGDIKSLNYSSKLETDLVNEPKMGPQREKEDTSSYYKMPESGEEEDCFLPFPKQISQDDTQNDNSNESTAEISDQIKSEERRRRKRKSRWGDAVAGASTSVVEASLTLQPPGKLPAPKSSLLSQLTRSDPGLIQYARQTFGSTNLSEEDWKKAEDHYKINLLYQDMVRKRAEVEKLERQGKFKYEYDSDEDTEGGTWEHKLRQQEMQATQLWAEELTRQAAGKHHIGDFLPPEELERFMEKYNAVKQGREPDLSDYKEFKLKEDNVGYRLLQKMGWNEGQGLGQDGSGITNPVNKAVTRHENQGLGVERHDGLEPGDDEYDAYRKRMMLAYRFRPNPLNNPRRPYY